MGENSHIEWCDHTFNPWIGCTKVSAGCTNCYAEGESKRRGWARWGKGKLRHRTSASYWKQPLKWDRLGALTVEFNEVLRENPINGVIESARQRVFCASLADWLDDEVPIEWLADLLALIHATPNLDWLLLTKRPENFQERLTAAAYKIPEPFPEVGAQTWVQWWTCGEPPENVWLGVSVEDQKRADERIPELLQIPAGIHFLSCEPLLSSLDLSQQIRPVACDGRPLWPCSESMLFGIDWVICGGESGSHARPMHPDWARSLRDQCGAADIPFFFKQWGEFVPRVGETTEFIRLGKKRAGRFLDGREWNEFPKAREALVAA